MDADRWVPIPDLTPGRRPRNIDFGRRPVGGDGFVTGPYGHVLDLRTQTWITVPHEAGLPSDGASSAWAAGRLVVFGGATWQDGDGALSDRTWTWRPPPR